MRERGSMTNYVVAAIVGLLNVLGLFTVAQFVYMGSWSTWTTRVTGALALLGLGVGSGLFSAFLASWAGWTSDGAVQGLASSLLGSAALRADLGKSDSPRKSGAMSAATPAAKTVFRLLDAHCRRQVEAWALGLSSANLMTAAGVVPARDTVRGQRAKLLQSAETTILNGGNHTPAARGQLVRYITKTYSTTRFPKPAL